MAQMGNDDAWHCIKTQRVLFEKRTLDSIEEFEKGDTREVLLAGTPPLFAARLPLTMPACAESPTTLVGLELACASLPWREALAIHCIAGRGPRASQREHRRTVREGTRRHEGCAPGVGGQPWVRFSSRVGSVHSPMLPGVCYQKQTKVRMVLRLINILCYCAPQNLEQVQQTLGAHAQRGEGQLDEGVYVAMMCLSSEGSLVEGTESSTEMLAQRVGYSYSRNEGCIGGLGSSRKRQGPRS